MSACAPWAPTAPPRASSASWPGTPVLQVRRTALALNDKPVEYRISTLWTAQHDYVSTLSPQA